MLGLDIESWSDGALWGAFFAASVVITLAGARVTRLADRLADLTGLGEAVVGALLLGGATSIPDLAASLTAASNGHAEMAVSNAIGGIAVQTTFLAMADVAYRHANLEHAAASIENLMQAGLLAVLLSVVLMGPGVPDVTVLGVHPLSLLLVAVYLFGMHLVRRAGVERLWTPTLTRQTRQDEPEDQAGHSLGRTAAGFAVLGSITAVTGYIVAETAIEIAARTGLSETVVGTFLTAVSTSLPELVTTVAAVRQGALTLAVGGIIGGNSFDVLVVGFSDVAYRAGSIYTAIGGRQVFLLSLAHFLGGTLLLGLLRRERMGLGRIGFESAIILVAYATAAVLQLWQG